MLTVRAPLAVVIVAGTVLAGSCAASDAGTRPVATLPATPSVTPPADATLPPVPPGGKVVEGAMAELRFGTPKKGHLAVSVKRTRTDGRVTVEGTFVRAVNCRAESIGVCHVQYDRTRVLPESAFTLDAVLGTATLRTTVEGKPLTLTWTGFGTGDTWTDKQGDEVVAFQRRFAVGEGQWGTFRHKDPRDEAKTTSTLYRRVHPKE